MPKAASALSRAEMAAIIGDEKLGKHAVGGALGLAPLAKG